MNWRFKLSIRLSLLRGLAVAAGTTLAACTADRGATAVSSQDSLSTDSPDAYRSWRSTTVTSVTVSPANGSLLVGATLQLTATARNADGGVITGGAVTWVSTSDTVSVSASGVARGNVAGSSRITATIAGKSGSTIMTATKVAVPAAVASVSLTPAALSVLTGATSQLTATLKDANGNVLTGRTVTWATSAAAAVLISTSGVATGVAAGSATITATSAGISGSAVVTTTAPAPAPVQTVAVSPASAGLNAGATQQLAAVLRDANGAVLTGRPVSWASSAPSVVSVSAAGLATGVSSGTATITATSGTAFGHAIITVAGVVTPPQQPGVSLASSDFNGGTLGPYTNPWGTGVSVVADPTNSGHGSVAKMTYAPGSGGSMERGISYVGSRLRYGQTIWMRGQVYLPSGSGAYNAAHNRKLIDYQGSPGTRMTLHRVGANDLRLSIVDWMNGSEQEVIATSTGIRIADNTWYTIEVRLTTNSADNVRDGILEVYINGSATPNYRLASGLGWITQKGNQPSYFDTYLIGFQLTINSGDPVYTDTRYWDNVAFSTSRVVP